MVIIDATIDETDIIESLIERCGIEIRADTQTVDGRHLVVADHCRKHRLWIRPRADIERACYYEPIGADADIRLNAALQFERMLRGRSSGDLPSLLKPSPYQRQRLIQLLRIADACADGASLHDVAYAIVHRHNRPLSGAAWQGSSERRTCQRLVAASRHLVDGNYRKLLSG